MNKNQKEIERKKLHSAIWSIAEDLRGPVEGWEFKNYVLGIMFYRYISENITSYINKNEHDSGNINFDYAKISDTQALEIKNEIVKSKGFFIKPSHLFCNVIKIAKQDSNLNITLENIFKKIESSTIGFESEKNFRGLFANIDVNSPNLGNTVDKRNEMLVKILNGIASMELGDYKNNTIDAFGDAYEYLMSMYASKAGRSGGQYFTPQEVSELLAKITIVGKTKVNKVYDPTCGSGSLLLKFAKILGKENIIYGFFGQDNNLTNYNLCRINMFLHDINFDKFNIACDDTLTSPHFFEECPFDVIVSNPPYSLKWAGNDNPILINDDRFAPAGVLAPKDNADFAFILHSLSWLSTNGTAAIVCFPGIFYRGKAEQKIRKYLIDNNFVDAIIQLPSNLFYGTPISTCILVLKKSKKTNDVLFIDASNECIKITNNNKLTNVNIENILNMFKDRKDIQYVTKIVGNKVIASEHEYNLSVNTYVEKQDTREQIDIKVLNKQIAETVEKENKLRKEIDKIISLLEE